MTKMLAESLPLQGAAQVRSRWLPVAVLASTAVVVLLSFNAPGSSFAVKDGANVKGQQLEMLYTQVRVVRCCARDMRSSPRCCMCR